MKIKRLKDPYQKFVKSTNTYLMESPGICHDGMKAEERLAHLIRIHRSGLEIYLADLQALFEFFHR